MSKVWFVTGASKGFGRQFVLAALERGDRVAATRGARSAPSRAPGMALIAARTLRSISSSVGPVSLTTVPDWLA